MYFDDRKLGYRSVSRDESIPFLSYGTTWRFVVSSPCTECTTSSPFSRAFFHFDYSMQPPRRMRCIFVNRLLPSLQPRFFGLYLASPHKAACKDHLFRDMT